MHGQGTRAERDSYARASRDDLLRSVISQEKQIEKKLGTPAKQESIARVLRILTERGQPISKTQLMKEAKLTFWEFNRVARDCGTLIKAFRVLKEPGTKKGSKIFYQLNQSETKGE